MSVREVVTRAWQGDGAELYERVRPGYPRAALEFIAQRFALGESSEVLDLAAGTGKFTRALAELGCRVAAVEPLEGMLAVLRRELPEATALQGSAEEIPLPDASVDVVAAAQAFHWFDAERAPREIARVLRPRGGLVAIWNTREESVGWMSAVRGVIERAKGDTPQHEDDRWRHAIEQSGLYEPLQLRLFDQVQELPRDQAVEVFASRSYVAALPEDERAEAIEAIAAAVPDEERIAIPYTTEVYWTTRSP